MNYIYCYINKLNQHKYVGQTNNFNRRVREHKSCAYNEKSFSYNHLIHKKIREYGIDSFEIEVLEKIYNQSQDYVNDRERFWIKEKNSFCGNGFGYNMDFGGGKKKSSKLTECQIIDIKDKIKNGVSYFDLEEEYNISPTFVSGINNGTYFFEETEKYPLYKYYKSKEDYDELIELLTKSELRFSDISKLLGIGYSTIKKINNGTLKKDLYPTHPIRKISANELRANKIKDLLLNSTYSKTEISKMLKTDLETIRRINVGITFKDDNLIYPLRNL